MNGPEQTERRILFSWRETIIIAGLFLGIWAVAWFTVRMLLRLSKAHGWELDLPYNFPMSMFSLRLPGVHAPWWTLGSALIVLAVFAICLWQLRRITARLSLVLLVGLVLILGTNLIQGVSSGLVIPQLGPKTEMSARPLQYYSDAGQIHSALTFLKQFEQRQLQLGCHARVHPPGAVLFYYGLRRLVDHPAVISLLITVIAVLLSGPLFYALMSNAYGRPMAGYATLLLLSVPNIQVYYCATLDGVIAGCLLAVVFCFRLRRTTWAIIGSMTALSVASSLTFLACFLGPVLLAFEWFSRRTVRRSFTVFIGVAVFHLVVYWVLGFNYLQAFRTAAAIDNPEGFFLFADPANYLLTRIEGVCEILVYFGPFLLVLLMRGLKLIWRRPTALATGTEAQELAQLATAGIGTLVAMFLTGTFCTGETGRVCLFMVPFLLMPVVTYLVEGCFWEKDLRRLLALVFGQALLMQTFAGFVW